MTKYITAEQCLGAIQADSSWRKKEISAIKQRISSSEDETQRILIRAGMVMLYAHWEGFVRFASQAYVSHINERVSRFNVILSAHYQKLLMWRCVRKRGEYPHAKSPIGFLDIIDEWSNAPERFLPDDMIDAESNLNADVLKKILRIIDIPFDAFETKRNLIDEKLLGARNPIAHGQRKFVTFKEYEQADGEVRGLIDLFQTRIETCVQNSSFLRQAEGAGV